MHSFIFIVICIWLFWGEPDNWDKINILIDSRMNEAVEETKK